MPHVVVIYNPVAGGSRGASVSERVQARLEAEGHTVERIATGARGGAAPVAAEVGERADRVVAVGGDGTLREVVEGLGDARARVVVGVVPMGNANVVAHELGIGDSTGRALDVLVHGHPTEMDLGTVRLDDVDGVFLAVVGLGWDADTVALLDRIRRSRLGRRAYRLWADGIYGVTGLRAALRRAQPRFRVLADGVPLAGGRYCAAFFCNLRTYGKGMAVAPGAHRVSGLIHAQARKRAAPPYVLWQLGAAVAKRAVPAFISDYADARHFVVEAEQPVPVQVDGDARGRATRIEIGVRPRALRILAPAGA